METSNSRPDMVDLDGRTGEGGGQVVRIALALSAILKIPLRIHHIRGNRMGRVRGGGLKAQHVACVTSLAKEANVDVNGGELGSQALQFIPTLSKTSLQNRQINIDTDSAASTLLVFQSIFPFLMFSADESNSPITVTMRGGTNVSFSSSFDYLDQVLLPALELTGVPIVERRLVGRGWSQGSRQVGEIKLKINPIPLGHSLLTSNWPVLDKHPTITKIDITIVVPDYLRSVLRDAFISKCNSVFPNIQTEIVVEEGSRHNARIYTLLVAHTRAGFRFGRDWLYDRKVILSPEELATQIAKKVTNDLNMEIQSGRGLDEYLQDQLIIFQALSNGVCSVNGDPEVFKAIKERNSGNSEITDAEVRRVEDTRVPFGEGSMHAKTARWVVSQMLPELRWYDDGKICEGAGYAKAPES